MRLIRVSNTFYPITQKTNLGNIRQGLLHLKNTGKIALIETQSQCTELFST